MPLAHSIAGVCALKSDEHSEESAIVLLPKREPTDDELFAIVDVGIGAWIYMRIQKSCCAIK